MIHLHVYVFLRNCRDRLPTPTNTLKDYIVNYEHVLPIEKFDGTEKQHNNRDDCSVTNLQDLSSGGSHVGCLIHALINGEQLIA